MKNNWEKPIKEVTIEIEKELRSIKNINRSVSDPTKYNKIYQGVNYKHGLIKNYLYFTHSIKKETDIKNKNEKNLRIVKL